VGESVTNHFNILESTFQLEMYHDILAEYPNANRIFDNGEENGKRTCVARSSCMRTCYLYGKDCGVNNDPNVCCEGFDWLAVNWYAIASCYDRVDDDYGDDEEDEEGTVS
jgi:hypothetical protein